MLPFAPTPARQTLLGLVLLFFTATATDAAAPGFTKSKVVGGLRGATSMEFAPDGRLFVNEQGGKLRVIKSGALLPTPFVDLSTTTDAAGERGFLGIAFDPNFTSNHYVYVYHTVRGRPPPPQPRLDGAVWCQLKRLFGLTVSRRSVA